MTRSSLTACNVTPLPVTRHHQSPPLHAGSDGRPKGCYNPISMKSTSRAVTGDLRAVTAHLNVVKADQKAIRGHPEL